MNGRGKKRTAAFAVSMACVMMCLLSCVGCGPVVRAPAAALESLNLEAVKESLDRVRFDFSRDGAALFLQRWKTMCTPEILEYFLQAGTDPSAVDSKGNSLLMYVCGLDNDYIAVDNDIFDMLLEYGADVQYANPSGLTALDVAVRNKYMYKVERLLEAGVEPTARTLEEALPSNEDANEFGEYEFARLILENLRSRKVEYSLEAPLEAALLGESEELIAYMERNPDWVPSWQVLVAAAAYCTPEALERLTQVLPLPPDVQPSEREWKAGVVDDVTALSAAAWYGNTDMVAYLLGRYAYDPIYHPSTLWKALQQDNIETADFLYGLGFDFDPYGEQDEGDVFLSLVEAGAIQGIQWVLEHGFTPTTVETSLALYSAAQRNHQDIIECLYSQGFDLNAYCLYTPQTAINAAAANGNVELVKWLSEHGARHDGYDPTLAVAASNNQLEIVKYLHEERGADIDGISPYEEEYQSTALGEAIGYGYFDLVKYLVENGADLEHVDRDLQASKGGETVYRSALEYAEMCESSRIREYFQQLS